MKVQISVDVERFQEFLTSSIVIAWERYKQAKESDDKELRHKYAETISYINSLKHQVSVKVSKMETKKQERKEARKIAQAETDALLGWMDIRRG